MSVQPEVPEWPDELRNIIATLASVQEALPTLARVLGDALGGGVQWPDAPNLHAVIAQITKARGELQKLHERLLVVPAHKLVSGYRLTEEQFYLLCAAGTCWQVRRTVELVDGGAQSDFELYQLFHYEDDRWVGMINPARGPGVGSGYFGRAPENISRGGLRADQREFFQKYLPAVFDRFRDDSSTDIGIDAGLWHRAMYRRAALAGRVSALLRH